MNRKSAAFELPEYAPNRGMQIWLWFVNISPPVTVWKAVSSKWQNCYQNPKLYMSHLGTSAPTSNVFSLPKYFCWAHFFSTWTMRLFASQWSPVRIHKRGRITRTLFSGCGEAQTWSTFRLSFSLPISFRMTRVRKRRFTVPLEPCNWSTPLGDGRSDFKVLQCPMFTAFQDSARIFWAGSPVNPSCAIFHTLYKMNKYALKPGLAWEFWACLTWAVQSPGHVPLTLLLSLFLCTKLGSAKWVIFQRRSCKTSIPKYFMHPS